MSEIHGFPPIVHRCARTLILGTMPSRASLASRQYYAHPRNVFWPFMELIFGIKRELPYEARCVQLARWGIAVWDVLRACRRSGSLDADIVASSIETNDFADFLSTYLNITRIYFNGTEAERLYVRYVRPVLPDPQSMIMTTRLPSTSPANASISFECKLQAWHNIRAP